MTALLVRCVKESHRGLQWLRSKRLQEDCGSLLVFPRLSIEKHTRDTHTQSLMAGQEVEQQKKRKRLWLRLCEAKIFVSLNTLETCQRVVLQGDVRLNYPVMDLNHNKQNCALHQHDIQHSIKSQYKIKTGLLALNLKITKIKSKLNTDVEFHQSKTNNNVV